MYDRLAVLHKALLYYARAANASWCGLVITACYFDWWETLALEL